MQRQYSFDDPPQFDNTNGRIAQPQPQQPFHSPLPLNPAAHPDSAFNRLRAQRRYSQQRDQQAYAPAPMVEPVSPISPPQPPPHRDAEGRFWGEELGYTREPEPTNITPGADNFGQYASGGMTGIAMSVADQNARESGLDAMRNTPGYDPSMENRPHNNFYPNEPYNGAMSPYLETPYARPAPHQELSATSLTPLGAAAFPPGLASPQARSMVSRSPQSFAHEPYVDNPFHQRHSRNLDPALTDFDPNSIEDDGDDGLEYRQANRGSMLSLGHNSDRTPPTGAVAGAAATGGVLGVLGGLVGKKATGAAGPQYDPVRDAYGGTGGGGNSYDLGPPPEKSEWLVKQAKAKKRNRCLIISLIAFLVAGAIVGGIVGGLVRSNKASAPTGSSSSNTNNGVSGASASDDSKNNGDLNKDSAEIKKLLNNADLHKVFPGVDYTPMYTQYPDCLSYPPSQNNVTRDLAVLSQLTNQVRLYGTDCNQTQMVLHSIDQLGLNGTMKVWMGVWQDTNKTTNARQLSQMYDIFKQHGSASFAGVIVGNEVLFRQDMTVAELTALITGVKANLTTMGINIPVASSDLGDDWTAGMAGVVDILMANIHPFFAGVTADAAAAWTWNFWSTHNLILQSDLSKNYISETGWPSKGGTDCGGATTCTNGSVAGITEMNTFMDSWVCDALTNGTNYFWFEAFDEPWKIKYNEKGKEWEDQWGLMDVNRNLKSGVKIPDCGGKTVSS